MPTPPSHEDYMIGEVDLRTVRTSPPPIRRRPPPRLETFDLLGNTPKPSRRRAR